MTRQQSHQAYAAAMRTMAGTRQIVMLYDAIIRNLQLAAEAMRDQLIEERYQRLSRASSIIFGLQSCLNFEQGGDVAPILRSFYLAIDLRIFSLHRTNSVADCNELVKEIKEMRDAWDAIDRDNAAPAQMHRPEAASAPAAALPESIAFSA
ncbi:MAG: flagellar export chaperone FliS [Alphaproteobacteria bacterium]|nr:flagellar export chaperone FliS [Alphaproteobacteria bacterium]